METADLVTDTICRTVELGLTITGATTSQTITRIDCQPIEYDPTCPNCGELGCLRDHVDRALTDLPVVGHLTRIHIRIPRFTCNDPGCEVAIFQQRLGAVAAPRIATTRRCSRWILQHLAIDERSVSVVAKALGLSWDTVNTLALSLT